jgi:hypothetical protein
VRAASTVLLTEHKCVFHCCLRHLLIPFVARVGSKVGVRMKVQEMFVKREFVTKMATCVQIVTSLNIGFYISAFSCCNLMSVETVQLL